MNAIDDYHNNAFTPEILTALSWIENAKLAAEIVHKNFKLKGEEGSTFTFNEQRFQTNLNYIQKKFEEYEPKMIAIENAIYNNLKALREMRKFIRKQLVKPSGNPFIEEPKDLPAPNEMFT